MAFEYNGKHHYEKTVFNGDGKKLKKIQNRDFIKNKICKENNIKLITISFKEIDHKTDNAKIENIILEKLNE